MSSLQMFGNHAVITAVGKYVVIVADSERVKTPSGKIPKVYCIYNTVTNVRESESPACIEIFAQIHELSAAWAKEHVWG